MTKLTDTQLVILSSASQREDGLAEIPSRLAGAARSRAVAPLLRQGFLKEIQARRDAPVWRRDEAEGSFALRLTRAGREAIGVADGEADMLGKPAPAAANAPRGDQRKQSSARSGSPGSPRDGTKIAGVIVLLQRRNGAALDDVVEATGWLPHTARAAITGLRKRGYVVETERGKNRRTSYRITGSPAVEPKASA
jgi:hypothetical protein